MAMEIKLYPDPILRTKAVPVKKVTDELRQLGHAMFAALAEHKAIGLAAPQVGRLERLIVIDTTKADKAFGQAWIMFNPEILYSDAEKFPYIEGCLSFPDKNIPIADRSGAVTVSFMDDQGKSHWRVFMGLTAVCIQHEIDHLNGILMIDHEEKKNVRA
jgi:peptide deformylase